MFVCQSTACNNHRVVFHSTTHVKTVWKWRQFIVCTNCIFIYHTTLGKLLKTCHCTGHHVFGYNKCIKLSCCSGKSPCWDQASSSFPASLWHFLPLNDSVGLLYRAKARGAPERPRPQNTHKCTTLPVFSGNIQNTRFLSASFSKTV